MANDNRDGTVGIFPKLRPWLLIAAAAALACVCVWAEAHGKLYMAQGTYIGILFLLAMAGVDWWREHGEKRVVPPELTTLYQALKYLLLAFAIGVIAVMVVAAGTDRWEQHIVARSAGTGILFAGGTFAIGVLFGFLFGFPPAPSSSTPQAAAQSSGAPPQGQAVETGGAPAAKHSISVFQNTNLHEISDWLTKVIVGAGLVDLTKLPPQVQKLAEFMAGYTDPGNPSPAVALAIMAYFSSCGVLFGYVWTRFESIASRLPDHDAEVV
jgi:hypothetical protein